MNYTTLQAAVADYLHRSDLTTQIQSYYIEFARLRIGRDVRGLANLKSTTVSAWPSSIGALPADVSRLRTVYFDNYPLQSVGPEQIASYINITHPTAYSIQGTQSIVIPGIGATDAVSIEYWCIPAALSAGTDVSEGMAEWPHIWITASTIEAAFWQRDWDTYNQLIPLYTAEVQAINAACAEALDGIAPMVTSDQPMLQTYSNL